MASGDQQTGFMAPKREVLQMSHMPKWQKSKAYADYLHVLTALNEAVKRKPLTEACELSDFVTQLVSLLDQLSAFIKQFPPEEQQQRYGNKAFRSWYGHLSEKINGMVSDLLPENLKGATDELVPYLRESFGNSTRIDYGSGHEASFVMFLACLFKLELLKQEDSVAAVNRVFERYLVLARELQQTYRMEPAGSHGVWSLDDYQFVPFIWGSAQLIDHPKLTPDSFTNESLVDRHASEYSFMGCIKYINQVKSGPFAEHSNQLWNMSAVPSWSKVNAGLIKMYTNEVLAKFPVVQHFLFGSLLSIEPK